MAVKIRRLMLDTYIYIVLYYTLCIEPKSHYICGGFLGVNLGSIPLGFVSLNV